MSGPTTERSEARTFCLTLRPAMEAQLTFHECNYDGVVLVNSHISPMETVSFDWGFHAQVEYEFEDDDGQTQQAVALDDEPMIRFTGFESEEACLASIERHVILGEGLTASEASS